MARKPLNAGFTGSIADNDRPAAKARHAVDRVRDEAGLVAAHAVDHPAATGSMVLAIGLAGLAIGYLLGASSMSPRGAWHR